MGKAIDLFQFSLFIWLCINLLASDSGLPTYMRLRKSMRAQQQSVAQMSDTGAQLEQLQDWLRNDPEYSEVIARKRWLFTQPSEEVIWYTGGDDES